MKYLCAFFFEWGESLILLFEIFQGALSTCKSRAFPVMLMIKSSVDCVHWLTSVILTTGIDQGERNFEWVSQVRNFGRI
jgi:hypothetical protein